ncbi:hypothetical protein HYW54_02105 [Candidatus Gottesmanbacteria bacterium]|nr:hypothetical protein [Candidatus Gottesmanbacteria bacterium]
MRKNLFPILLPILISSYPIFFIYSHNITGIHISGIFLPLFFIVACTLFVFALLNIFIKNIYKSSLIVSLSALVILSYGHIFDLLRQSPLDSLLQGKQTPGFIAAIAIIFLTSYLILKSKSNLISIMLISNFIGIALLIPSLFEIIKYDILYSLNYAVNEKTYTWQVTSSNQKNPPDIYYFVFDRYGRSDILENVYQFDNSQFIKFLQDSNFSIPQKSWANYTQTQLSLSSSLNMEYHDDLIKSLGRQSDDIRPLIDLIEDYSVLRFLKSNGYLYIHAGSWWGPTAWNRNADKNINLPSLSEFSEIVYSKSLFHPLTIKLNIPLFNSRLTHCKRPYYKFDEIAKVPDISKPTFTFAHFLLTHEPYVFDKDGNCLSQEETDKRSEKRNYEEQIVFANKKIQELVNTIMEKSKENPPIIIIQGDEGPYPEAYRKGELNFDWKNATEEEKRQKMAILNAYYLPLGGDKLIYPEITPVNTFRLILKYYFGQDIEQLPNTAYFSNKSSPYKFTVITKNYK